MKYRKWMAVLAALCVAGTAAGCGSRTSDTPSVSEESGSVQEPSGAEAEKTTEESQEETESFESWEHEETEAGSREEETKETLPGDGDTFVQQKVIVATDLHYLAEKLAGNRCQSFMTAVESSDGRVLQYGWEILDAFLDDVIEEDPDLVILTGDLTLNGEKESHEELADKLEVLSKHGIEVAVIPGNHDINNHYARKFTSDGTVKTDVITADEFSSIYADYGYVAADNRDPASLSYLYKLDDYYWLLMLDSCQYEPENKVEGRIKESTLAWMDEQLLKAREQGIFVLPIAHHNLLAQSRMYTTQCAMDNNKEVISLLQKYELPLFFSGHLHVQRIRKHKSEPGVPEGTYGIQEIVTDALSIPPCQYGEVLWEEDGSISYATRAVDVSAWARKNGSTNPDLLDFEDWSYRYIQKLISDQIRGVVKNLGADVEHSMAAAYAGVYIDYYAGREIDVKGIKSTKGYRFWERNMPDSYLIRELDAMIADSDRDNNYFLLPEEEGWITGD